MIVLSTTTDRLEVSLSAAGADVDLAASWREIDTVNYLPDSSADVSNGTSAVVVVGSPVANKQRVVDMVSAFNNSVSPRTVIVSLIKSGVARKLITVKLGGGESLQFCEGAGWSVRTASGADRVETVTDQTLGVPVLSKPLYKASLASEGASTWSSLWLATGVPTAAVTPPVFTAGTGYIPTRATVGAVGQLNATAGSQLRLRSVTASSATAGTLGVYDRLWHCSGFNTTLTTLQSVTTPGTITGVRNPSNDAEIWLQVYTAPGATTATWTVSYLDLDSAARTATYVHPANAESVGQTIPCIMPAAGRGVLSITGFQCSATSGTAGNVGITVRRRYATAPILLANTGVTVNTSALVPDDVAFEYIVGCTATSTGIWTGDLQFLETTV